MYVTQNFCELIALYEICFPRVQFRADEGAPSIIPSSMLMQLNTFCILAALFYSR